MRQLKLTKSHTPPGGMRAQADALMLQWAALGAAGLSPEATALRPRIDDCARYVVSLAQQHQGRGASPEALLTVAHGALIGLLNQYVHLPDKLDKVLGHGLHSAVVLAVQAHASGPH